MNLFKTLHSCVRTSPFCFLCTNFHQPSTALCLCLCHKFRVYANPALFALCLFIILDLITGHSFTVQISPRLPDSSLLVQGAVIRLPRVDRQGPQCASDFKLCIYKYTCMCQQQCSVRVSAPCWVSFTERMKHLQFSKL